MLHKIETSWLKLRLQIWIKKVPSKKLQRAVEEALGMHKINNFTS